MFAFLGPVELVVCALVILLLFGNRLPGVMRSMGQGMMEFKKGIQGIEDRDDSVNVKDTASKRT